MSANKQVRLAQAIAGKPVLSESIEEGGMSKDEFRRNTSEKSRQHLKDAKSGKLKGAKTIQTISGEAIAYVGDQGIAAGRDMKQLHAILKMAGLNPKDFKKVGGIGYIGPRPSESIEETPLNEASGGHYAISKDGKVLYTDTNGISIADGVVHHGFGDFGGMVGDTEVYFMRIDNTAIGNALKDAGFVGRPHEVSAGKKSRATFKVKTVAKVFKDKGSKLVRFEEPSSKSESFQEQIAAFRAPLESIEEAEGTYRKEWHEFTAANKRRGATHLFVYEDGDRVSWRKDFLILRDNYAGDGDKVRAAYFASKSEAEIKDETTAMFHAVGKVLNATTPSSQWQDAQDAGITDRDGFQGRSGPGHQLLKVKWEAGPRKGKTENVNSGNLTLLPLLGKRNSFGESIESVDEEGNPWLHKYVDGKPRLVRRGQNGKGWVGKAPVALPPPPLKAKKESDEGEPIKQDPRFLTRGQNNYTLIGQMMSEAKETLFEQPEPDKGHRWIVQKPSDFPTRQHPKNKALPDGWKWWGESLEESQQIAKTMLQQMGGQKRLAMMTGAKNFVWDGKIKTLSFKIGRNAKGVNHVRITLRNDLYDMKFGAVRKHELKVKSEEHSLSAEMLGPMFEKHTGMYLKLSPGDEQIFGRESVDEAEFIAKYAGKTLELTADSLYAAKLKAIKELRIPKSKVGLLALMNKKEYDKGGYRYESVDEAKSESTLTEASRPLHQIAAEIEKAWKKVNFAARPYLDAMHSMDSIRDNYGADPGSSIVAYFLANARSFTGPEAKAIKVELKKMLKESEESSDNLQEQVANFRQVVESTPFEEQKSAFRALLELDDDKKKRRRRPQSLQKSPDDIWSEPYQPWRHDTLGMPRRESTDDVREQEDDKKKRWRWPQSLQKSQDHIWSKPYQPWRHGAISMPRTESE